MTLGPQITDNYHIHINAVGDEVASYEQEGSSQTRFLRDHHPQKVYCRFSRKNFVSVANGISSARS